MILPRAWSIPGVGGCDPEWVGVISYGAAIRGALSSAQYDRGETIAFRLP